MIFPRRGSNSILAGAFDESFQSRIHVSLYFPQFNEFVRAKLWDRLLIALEKDHGNLYIASNASKYIEEDDAVRELHWNGKQMQNGKSFVSETLHKIGLIVRNSPSDSGCAR